MTEKQADQVIDLLRLISIQVAIVLGLLIGSFMGSFVNAII